MTDAVDYELTFSNQTRSSHLLQRHFSIILSFLWSLLICPKQKQICNEWQINPTHWRQRVFGTFLLIWLEAYNHFRKIVNIMKICIVAIWFCIESTKAFLKMWQIWFVKNIHTTTCTAEKIALASWSLVYADFSVLRWTGFVSHTTQTWALQLQSPRTSTIIPMKPHWEPVGCTEETSLSGSQQS